MAKKEKAAKRQRNGVRGALELAQRKLVDAALDAKQAAREAGEATASFVERNQPELKMVGGSLIYVGGCVGVSYATSILGLAAGAAAICGGAVLLGQGFYEGLTRSSELSEPESMALARAKAAAKAAAKA